MHQILPFSLHIFFLLISSHPLFFLRGPMIKMLTLALIQLVERIFMGHIHLPICFLLIVKKKLIFIVFGSFMQRCLWSVAFHSIWFLLTNGLVIKVLPFIYLRNKSHEGRSRTSLSFKTIWNFKHSGVSCLLALWILFQ